jgi:transcriptional regulator with XRE-family HTH domain
MMFTERIKQLREERQIQQRKLAAVLDIDTTANTKKGERPKREQVVIIAKLLQTDEKELLSLWLADQLIAVVAKEKDIADQVLDIAKQNINILF